MEARAVVVRRCGNSFCREVGHTVRNCRHEFIERYIKITEQVSKYSVGMNRPNFIGRWLRGSSIHELKLLIEHPGSNSIARLADVLFNKYYNEVLAAGDGDEGDRRQRVLQTMTMEEREAMRTRMNLAYLRTIADDPIRAPAAPLRLRAPAAPLRLRAPAAPAAAPLRVPLTPLELARMDLQRINHNLSGALSEATRYRLVYERARDAYIVLVAQQQVAQARVNALNAPPMPLMELCVEPWQEEEGRECSICYEVLTANSAKMGCNHTYCSPCMNQYISSLAAHKPPCCGECRRNILKVTFSCNEDVAELRGTLNRANRYV